VVIWVDIWNFQSSSNAKILINRCFNIGNYIAMIYRTNINPRVLQYKNCWKWSHTTFAYWIHKAKCPKYNRLYKIKNHRDMAWCCKANFKINPLWLETSKDESCSHFFKFVNCKGDHQVDSYNYLFCKYRFNHD